jgi:pimeloyl-ACP methyl ester carboxylesterase
MTEELQIRIHGSNANSTLVYLPGLHGDWTLVGSFRRAVADQVRFVEFAYPRTATWSLTDYACAVEATLAAAGIRRAWVLAESFGSQVAWSMIERGRFQLDGLILAGGFVQHPLRWGVRLAERLCGAIPLALMVRLMFGYARLARIRYRHSPETLAGVQEFIQRRTEPDRRAATHRLRLVAESRPGPVARCSTVPLYGITGAIDPVVPWFLVRPWLRHHCPALREYRVVWLADHNILGSAAEPAAAQVLQWMKAAERGGP